MKIDWKAWAPVELDGAKEAKTIFVGLCLAAAWGVFDFAAHYIDALNALYYNSGLTFRKLLIPGAVMEEFSSLILGCDTLFNLICLTMPLLAAYHYGIHCRSSMSIYLMRRLPDRWELHRRCLLIPLGGAAAAMAVLGLLGIVFYLIYILCTPAQCLPA